MKKLVIVVGILAIVLVVFAIWLLSPASDNPNAKFEHKPKQDKTISTKTTKNTCGKI